MLLSLHRMGSDIKAVLQGCSLRGRTSALVSVPFIPSETLQPAFWLACYPVILRWTDACKAGHLFSLLSQHFHLVSNPLVLLHWRIFYWRTSKCLPDSHPKFTWSWPAVHLFISALSQWQHWSGTNFPLTVFSKYKVTRHSIKEHCPWHCQVRNLLREMLTNSMNDWEEES